MKARWMKPLRQIGHCESASWERGERRAEGEEASSIEHATLLQLGLQPLELTAEKRTTLEALASPFLRNRVAQ